MAQPSTLPTWNTDASNRSTPTSGQQTSGWTVGQAPPSSWFNWLAYWTYAWLVYLQNLAGEAFAWTALHTHTRKISIDTTGNDEPCINAKSPTGNSPAIAGYDSFIGVQGATSSTSSGSSGVRGTATAGAAGRFESHGTGPALLLDTTYSTGPALVATGKITAGNSGSSEEGLRGTSGSAAGVRGGSTTGSGVYGESSSGPAVSGYSTSGMGAQFTSGTGPALQLLSPQLAFRVPVVDAPPPTGEVGDVWFGGPGTYYLWLCVGSGVWKKVALT